MFGFFRKRRAIKSFVRDMGPTLRRNFGTKPHYSPEEVRQAGRLTGSSPDFLHYAFCIYCTHAAFDALHAGEPATPSYDELRREVGDSHFGGSTTFDANTPLEADSPSSSDSGGSDGGWSGDSSGGWDSGGGGGDFGGGGGGGDCG